MGKNGVMIEPFSSVSLYLDWFSFEVVCICDGVNKDMINGFISLFAGFWGIMALNSYNQLFILDFSNPLLLLIVIGVMMIHSSISLIGSSKSMILSYLTWAFIIQSILFQSFNLGIFLFGSLIIIDPIISAVDPAEIFPFLKKKVWRVYLCGKNY